VNEITVALAIGISIATAVGFWLIYLVWITIFESYRFRNGGLELSKWPLKAKRYELDQILLVSPRYKFGNLNEFVVRTIDKKDHLFLANSPSNRALIYAIVRSKGFKELLTSCFEYFSTELQSDPELRAELETALRQEKAAYEISLASIDSSSVRDKAIKRLLWSAPVTFAVLWAIEKFSPTTPRSSPWFLIGIAIPLLPFLESVIELISGVPIFELSRRWDDLKGWQRGVLGTLVVVIALVTFMTIAIQFVPE
jgi:hypothetical protein